jgi:methyltransferase (TIGR00027 family)
MLNITPMEKNLNLAIQDVTDTALWVAVYRARESKKARPLFDDPLAIQLTQGRAEEIAAQMDNSALVARYTEWQVVIRTYIIDSIIQAQVNNGVDVVVNLGAGLDTRPYRLNLPPQLCWIEVDFANINKFKSETLRDQKPRCELQQVSMDLTNREDCRNLFTEIQSRHKKALVLAEGLIPYLTTDQVGMLAEEMKAHEHIALWLVDYSSPELLAILKKKKGALLLSNAPIVFFPNDELAFFFERGWKVEETRYLTIESQKLGRPLPMPWWSKVIGFFISKKTKEKFEKCAGFTLLSSKS